MWFYELKAQLHSGFLIDMEPEPRVKAQLDATRVLVLPLGRSIKRYLVHPEDTQQQFRMRFGDLQDSTQGLVLVKQEIEEAKNDQRALVLIGLVTDPTEGEAIRFDPPRDGRAPQVLQDRILVFEPGDAMRVNYLSRVAPFQTELEWDGRRMYRNSRKLESRSSVAQA